MNEANVNGMGPAGSQGTEYAGQYMTRDGTVAVSKTSPSNDYNYYVTTQGASGV